MMTNAQLDKASLDDIVFDGRNRHYGAYELRALYQRHMTRALVIATTMFAVLLVFPVAARLLAPDAAPVITKHEVIMEVMPPPLDKKIVEPPVVEPVRHTPPPPPAPPVATTRFTAFKPVPDEQATEKVPEQDELNHTTVAAVTSAGSTDPNTIPLEPIEKTSGGGVVPDVSKPFVWVEQMPELPGGGGQPAIVKAIQTVVHYPAQALRNQIEGKVFVSFTVNASGDVTDVKIVKGLGYGIDEETMRAIKTLPRFIPGRQNGREVSVSFTVPVTYKIQ